MPTAVIDLGDRVVADDGTVVCSYELLLELARDGHRLAGLTSFDTDGIAAYNRVSQGRISTWSDDGVASGPHPGALEWRTPDVDGSLVDRLRLAADALGAGYVERLELELAMFDDRGMMPLLHHVDWMVRDWTARGIVWGAGRGSSCASLALHLVGLHEVDPVRHRIPISEFLR